MIPMNGNAMATGSLRVRVTNITTTKEEERRQRRNQQRMTLSDVERKNTMTNTNYQPVTPATLLAQRRSYRMGKEQPLDDNNNDHRMNNKTTTNSSKIDDDEYMFRSKSNNKNISNMTTENYDDYMFRNKKDAAGYRPTKIIPISSKHLPIQTTVPPSIANYRSHYNLSKGNNNQVQYKNSDSINNNTKRSSHDYMDSLLPSDLPHMIPNINYDEGLRNSSSTDFTTLRNNQTINMQLLPRNNNNNRLSSSSSSSSSPITTSFHKSPEEVYYDRQQLYLPNLSPPTPTVVVAPVVVSSSSRRKTIEIPDDENSNKPDRLKPDERIRVSNTTFSTSNKKPSKSSSHQQISDHHEQHDNRHNNNNNKNSCMNNECFQLQSHYALNHEMKVSEDYAELLNGGGDYYCHDIVNSIQGRRNTTAKRGSHLHNKSSSSEEDIPTKSNAIRRTISPGKQRMKVSPEKPRKKKTRSIPKSAPISSNTTAGLGDTLVIVGNETNECDRFVHSYLILAYASSVLAQHIVRLPPHDEFQKHSQQRMLYELRIPNKPANEWKMLQLFLEPPTIETATITIENMPSLLPWFHELQLSVQLQACDALLVHIVTTTITIHGYQMNLQDQLLLPRRYHHDNSIGCDNSTILTNCDENSSSALLGANIDDSKDMMTNNSKKNHYLDKIMINENDRLELQRQALIDLINLTRISCRVQLIQSKKMGLSALANSFMEHQSIWLLTSEDTKNKFEAVVGILIDCLRKNDTTSVSLEGTKVDDNNMKSDEHPFFDTIEAQQLYGAILLYLPVDLISQFVNDKYEKGKTNPVGSVKDLLQNPLFPYLLRQGLITYIHQKKSEQEQQKLQQSLTRAMRGEPVNLEQTTNGVTCMLQIPQNLHIPKNLTKVANQDNSNENIALNKDIPLHRQCTTPPCPTSHVDTDNDQFQKMTNEIQATLSAVWKLSAWVLDIDQAIAEEEEEEEEDDDEEEDRKMGKRKEVTNSPNRWIPNKPVNFVGTSHPFLVTTNARREWLQLMWQKLQEPSCFEKLKTNKDNVILKAVKTHKTTTTNQVRKKKETTTKMCLDKKSDDTKESMTYTDVTASTDESKRFLGDMNNCNPNKLIRSSSMTLQLTKKTNEVRSNFPTFFC